MRKKEENEGKKCKCEKKKKIYRRNKKGKKVQEMSDEERKS